MTTISASLVKELRDKTGAGMMDCKTALTETKGDIESAVDWLRKKGLSKAANKAGRIAAEGLIGVIAKDKGGAMVEVNSETDFVARNEQFQDMVRNITALAPKAGGDLAKLLALTYPGKSATVEDQVKETVATIGENMSVRRTVAMSVGDGRVSPSTCTTRSPTASARSACWWRSRARATRRRWPASAASSPCTSPPRSPPPSSAEELDPALIERERTVYTEQAKASGKSDEIVAKMVEGRLRKEFYQQVVLMEQTFLGAGGDGKATVAQVLKGAEKTAGAPIKIARFARYALGEGIDKKDDDFAAEVAKAAGKR